LYAGDAAQFAAFIDLSHTLTRAMGAPLAEQDDPSRFHQVLDLACGPGSWVIDLAHAFPHMDVAGIDASTAAINYALARAHPQRLLNASFEVMDILAPLDFSDHTFDLVNIGPVAPAFLALPGPRFYMSVCAFYALVASCV